MKYLTRSNFTEEGIILDHGFRKNSPLEQRSHGGRQFTPEEELGLPSKSPFPQARTHLLNVLQLLQIALLAVSKYLTGYSLWLNWDAPDSVRNWWRHFTFGLYMYIHAYTTTHMNAHEHKHTQYVNTHTHTEKKTRRKFISMFPVEMLKGLVTWPFIFLNFFVTTPLSFQGIVCKKICSEDTIVSLQTRVKWEHCDIPKVSLKVLWGLKKKEDILKMSRVLCNLEMVHNYRFIIKQDLLRLKTVIPSDVERTNTGSLFFSYPELLQDIAMCSTDTSYFCSLKFLSLENKNSPADPINPRLPNQEAFMSLKSHWFMFHGLQFYLSPSASHSQN